MTSCLFDVNFEEKIHNLTERETHWEDQACPCRMCDHLHKNDSEQKKKDRLDLRRRYKNIIDIEQKVDEINKKLFFLNDDYEKNMKKEHKLGHFEYGLK